MIQRRPAARLPRLRLAVALVCTLAFLAPATASAAVGRAPLTDGGRAAAAPDGTTIRLVQVATVDKPVLAIGARDGTNRLFIVAKSGRIRVMKNGSLLATPFLNIAAQVSKGGEQGLLGLAFHPGFATNRKFYVNFTNTAGDTIIREYRASPTNPDVAAPSSARTLLKIAQPYANHNGGMLAFGTDGFLYIGVGDGGSGNDPRNRAQSTATRLGKLLRINVNGRAPGKQYSIPASNPYRGKPGVDEIWQRGLRNPWRFSFDRANGNLWIADVGQGRYEEVNRAVRNAAGPGRGFNWGWRVMEGRHCNIPRTGCNTKAKQKPLIEYAHGAGRCSVTGGYVYRGSAIPALAGWYVYGDYCSGEIWATPSTAAAPAGRILLRDTSALIAGFGEDDAGELYLCDLQGSVYRIAAN